MITGIEVPLEWVALCVAACFVAGLKFGELWTSWRIWGRKERRHGPLGDLLKSETLTKTIDLAARRNAVRARSHAVLHGRIDRLESVSGQWGAAAHDEVRDHIAAVLRAGLRRKDAIALGKSNDFTITLVGADERAAVNIADRLRQRLSRLRLSHLGNEDGLTVNFGVAAAASGDDAHRVGRLAHRALRVAVARGADHVVRASEIEEIKLLPAPTPTMPGAASVA